MTGQATRLPFHYAGTVLMPAIYLIAQLLIAINKDCFNFHVGVREGWAVERLTFLFLALGSVVAFGVGLQARKTRLHGLFFLGLAGALFFGAGEEVSWGQRALQLETPDWLAEVNTQKEINLHNALEGLTDFSTNKAVEWGAFAFGVVGPLAARKGRVPLPSLLLVPGFLLAAVLMQGRSAEFEKEVGELVISLGLLVYLLMTWQQFQGSAQRVTPRGLLVAGLLALALVPAVLLPALAVCPT
jgi:predicted membrane protein